MADSFLLEPGEDLESVLRRASAYLAAAGIDSARVDAELLAAFVLEASGSEPVSRGRLQALALMGREVSADFAQRYASCLEERASRLPLQHITGVAHFRSLALAVGPGVFVPRPETELLVEHALGEIDRREDAARRAGTESQLKIADLCTGSGAIAGSIKAERGRHRVFAVELSEFAHAWASRNLEPLGVDLLLGDATVAFAGQEGTFDLVASNPPYIPNGAVPKDPEVRDHDPAMALYGGSEDGMKIPAQITRRAFELLKPGGYFIVEHAETQRQLMRQTLLEVGFEEILSIDDLAGRPRHTAGYKPL